LNPRSDFGLGRVCALSVLLLCILHLLLNCGQFICLKVSFLFLHFFSVLTWLCLLSLLTQLFSDIVPKTCANFRSLCTGECGESAETESKLHYDGSIIHRIVPNGWIQGGGMHQFVVTLQHNLGIGSAVRPSACLSQAGNM